MIQELEAMRTFLEGNIFNIQLQVDVAKLEVGTLDHMWRRIQSQGSKNQARLPRNKEGNELSKLYF